MATKDKRHDPGVNLYSDEDSDGELNNTKLSPGSSPSAHDVESVFIYNDVRKGGPLECGGGGSKREDGDTGENDDNNGEDDGIPASEDDHQVQEPPHAEEGAALPPVPPPPPRRCSAADKDTAAENCPGDVAPEDGRYKSNLFHCTTPETHFLCWACATKDGPCPQCEAQKKDRRENLTPTRID